MEELKMQPRGRMPAIIVVMLVVTMAGCNLIGDHHKAKKHALLHHHQSASQPQETVAVEVGGLVAKPGIFSIPEKGIRLRQALLLAEGVPSAAGYRSPYDILVSHREADIDSTTTYYPLPLVEEGIAGEIQLLAGSVVSVVNRDSTSLNPLSLPGDVLLTRLSQGKDFRVRGLVQKLLSTSGSTSLANLATPAQGADAMVVTRQSSNLPGAERFVILRNEPAGVAPQEVASSANSVPRPATNAGPYAGRTIVPLSGNRSLILPQGIPVGTLPAADPGPTGSRPVGQAGGPLAAQIPRNSPLLPQVVSNDELATQSSTQVPTPASASVSPAATATPPASTTLKTTAEQALVFKGDDIQYTRLALLPEVLSGLVMPGVERGIDQRLSAMQQMHQEKKKRLEAAEQGNKGTSVGGLLRSGRQSVGRVAGLATGMFQ